MYILHCRKTSHQDNKGNVPLTKGSGTSQGSKKPPSVRPGQVHFPFGQVTFSPYLPDGQGPRSGKPFAGLIVDNDFEKES